MKIGIMMFSTDETAGPAELATAVEERGFESLFLPEHSHIPVSRSTPYPMGGDMPREYYRTYDPFIGLAAAATATTTLRIGTGVCLVAQHDPLFLAKQVATLDRLSSGRFVFGIGYGWNVEEIENHGMPFAQRRDATRQKLLAMRRLWMSEVAESADEHAAFTPSWSWPKPMQLPQPPVILGGAGGPKLFAHIVEYGDGWAPIGTGAISRGLPVLQEAFAAAGRDPQTLQLNAFDPRTDDASVIERYAALGVQRLVITIPPTDLDGVHRQLDTMVPLLAVAAR